MSFQLDPGRVDELGHDKAPWRCGAGLSPRQFRKLAQGERRLLQARLAPPALR